MPKRKRLCRYCGEDLTIRYRSHIGEAPVLFLDRGWMLYDGRPCLAAPWVYCGDKQDCADAHASDRELTGAGLL